MKKLVIIVLVAFLVGGIIVGAKPTKNPDLIRIHIRANSNSEIDLEVSTVVRNNIIGYLSDRLLECNDKAEAYELISNNLANLEHIANNTLSKYNLYYTARIMLREEEMPARKYMDYMLNEGVYDSLTVELGGASGEDWWCVAYPPICFNDNGDYHYKSRVEELMEKYL